MTTAKLMSILEKSLRENIDGEIGRIDGENAIGITDQEGKTWFITIDAEQED